MIVLIVDVALCCVLLGMHSKKDNDHGAGAVFAFLHAIASTALLVLLIVTYVNLIS